MDVNVAAGYFDTIPVFDGYTDEFLFNGQLDLFDGTERDAETTWRRTVSAVNLVASSRGCIRIGDTRYLTGRKVEDFFYQGPIRQSQIIHPADGLFSCDSSSVFLAAGTPATFYAGFAWLKDRKYESLESELTPVYDVFCSTTDTPLPGHIIKDHRGVYHRVQGVSLRSGGLLAVKAFELGAGALRSVSYTSSGEYDPATDSSGASAPASVQAFVEQYMNNYVYFTNASEKYEKADATITVLAAAVADPKPGDTVVDGSTTYRVLELTEVDGAAFELHVRPV